MLFVIFTAEGLQEAQQEVLANQAELWLNPGLKDESDLGQFERAGILVHALPEETDAANEKAVMAALAYVESQSRDKDIFVEYL